MRRFNVTGICVHHEHYMVDISKKLDEIEKLVDDKQYFTINRARQYGKTTTLLHLRRRLEKRGEYVCAGISFGNVGLNAFETEEAFCGYYVSKEETSRSKDLEPCVLDRDVIKDKRHGRLIFLTYLKPLLNGQGNYYIESQFTDHRRMDLVVDFEKEQYIVELKIWRGEAANNQAYEQLLDYMSSKNASEGYLLTFDFRKNRVGVYKAEWIEVNGKRTFDVLV